MSNAIMPGKAHQGLHCGVSFPQASKEPDSCSHLVDTLSSDLEELGATINSLEARLDWVLGPRSDVKAQAAPQPQYEGIMRQKLQGVRENIMSKRIWINEIIQRLNL